MDYFIRMARRDDAQGILDIYAKHVLLDAITFEYAVPTASEMSRRIEYVSQEFPYFVAEDASGILGYAYAGRLRTREAYQWTSELSIYIREDAQGKGIGRALVTKIIDALKAMGVKTLYAIITYPNDSSVGFHEKMGFKRLYVFDKMGYKLGRWWGVMYTSMPLGDYVDEPEPIVPYPALVQAGLVM